MPQKVYVNFRKQTFRQQRENDTQRRVFNRLHSFLAVKYSNMAGYMKQVFRSTLGRVRSSDAGSVVWLYS